MLAFVAVAVVVIVTPGPDTALTIRNVLRGGRRAGVQTAAGVALGQCAWTILAAFGIAALLAASAAAFTAIKVAGACYLAYLGARSLLEAFRGAPHADDPERAPRTSRGALRQGLYSNIANPKMAAFFTSLLPQFAPRGSIAASLGLGFLFAALTLAWLSVYATAVARFRRALGRRPVKRVLDAVSGATLVGLAVRVAAERR